MGKFKEEDVLQLSGGDFRFLSAIIVKNDSARLFSQYMSLGRVSNELSFGSDCYCFSAAVTAVSFGQKLLKIEAFTKVS